MTTTELQPPIARPEAGNNLSPLPPHVLDFMAAVEHSTYPASPIFVLPEAPEDSSAARTLHIGNRGLHLDARAFDFLSSEGQLPPQFGFDLQRARGFNAKRSAHQVFFGDITYQDMSTNEATVQPVAVKWFEKGHNKALHEYKQLKALAAKGFSVFLPAGILVTEHAEYLITHYEDALSTLDNENWAYTQSSDPECRLMESRLEDMANALAELHMEARTFHGDAKTRNIARTIDGSTHFIDFESAETVADTQDWLASFKKKSGADIISLYKSLQENRGLFDNKKKQGLNGNERHTIFRKLFVDYYVSAVARQAAQLAPEERKVLADSLYGLQNDIYFAVFEDWDKRKIPPAKRDQESVDPHFLLGINNTNTEQTSEMPELGNGSGKPLSLKVKANRTRSTAMHDKQRARSLSRPSEEQTARWLGHVVDKTLGY